MAQTQMTIVANEDFWNRMQRMMDETFDRKFDQKFDEKFGPAFDQAFNKAFGPAFDERFDAAFDRKMKEWEATFYPKLTIIISETMTDL